MAEPDAPRLSAVQVIRLSADAPPEADVSAVDEETLTYVPRNFLAQRSSYQLLAATQTGGEARTWHSSCHGIALFCDMSGFSRLAASLAGQDKAHSAERLSQTLNGFLARLVAQLHSRGLEPLVFAGDAVIAFRPAGEGDEGAMREAAGAVVEAALAMREFRLERNGCPLATHCGLGAGELRTLAARGEGALQLLHGGEAMRQCCEAAAASRAGEVLLSAELRRAGRAGAGGGGARAAAAGRGAAGAGAGAGAGGGHGPYGEIRPIFVAFLGFPELDATAHAAAPADAAARFGQIVRSLHRVAAEWSASVNKIFLDEKGCSALLCWGLAGGFAHEDDAERAVRAAAALEEWFEEAAAPFAAGVAGGRAFCGPLGAPCRREFAVIGDAVIVAARLMGSARAATAAGAPGGRRQALLCDRSVVEAVAARGRRAALPFAELPPILAKGFEKPSLAAAPTPPPRPRPGAGLRGAAPRGRRVPGAGAELERALRAVAAAAAGVGGTVLLEGEAGFGKSALLHELARECAGRGFALLRAGAEAVEESTPLWALRGLVASATSAASEAGDGKRSYVARRGSLEAPGLALVGVGRLARVAACLAALVEGLAGPRARPVALALEDVHWLDSASWFVLRCLREAAPRLLLLMTSRPMPEPPRDFLLLAGRLAPDPSSSAASSSGEDDGILESARSTPTPAPALEEKEKAAGGGAGVRVVDVRLGALERGAARELLERLSGRLGVEWTPAALERVLDKAAGVPLYLVELVRAAAGDPEGRSPHSAALPDSLQQIVLSRVDQLPAAARDLLKIAAVIDTGFTLAAVAAVAGPERDPVALRDAFRALADARLVAEAGRTSLAGAAAPSEAATAAEEAEEVGAEEAAAWPNEEAPFVFSHALVREAVLSSLTAPHRRHGGGEPERALRHLERAAQRAHDAGALPEAARLYARLVALLDSLGLAGPPVPPLPAGTPHLPAAISAAASAGAGIAPAASRAAPASAEETARWRCFRTVALKNWCYIEYYLGHAELSLNLGLATIASAGAEMPRRKLALPQLLRFALRAVALVKRKWPERPSATAAAAAGEAWSAAEAETVALFEVYVVTGWTAMKTSSAGEEEAKGSSALALTMTGGIIGMERARRCAYEHWPEGRGLAWFSVLLYFMGLEKEWRAMMARAAEIGERHDSDVVREATKTAASSPLYVDGATYCAYVRLFLGRFGDAEEHARGLEAYLHRTGGADYGREIVAMVAGYSALFTGREAEAGRLLGRLEARGGAASFWTTTVAAVLRGLHAWRARGETGAMAAAAAGLERLLSRDGDAVLWIHVLPLACALDFLLWRAADARRRAGRPAPAAPAPAPPRGRRRRGGRRGAGGGAEAEGAVRRLAGLMRALRKKSLACLAPFCALAQAEEPGLAPARRAELLRGAAEALEAAELRPFHAVARLRLALAEAAAGAAGPAAASLQRAERAARECGLRLPALERALAEGAAPAPRPYAFASMFV
eukprot:tig00000498_g1626.t1